MKDEKKMMYRKVERKKRMKKKPTGWKKRKLSTTTLRFGLIIKTDYSKILSRFTLLALLLYKSQYFLIHEYNK